MIFNMAKNRGIFMEKYNLNSLTWIKINWYLKHLIYEDNQIAFLCTALPDEKLANILEHEENIQLKIINYLTNERF